jgi:type IV pilus assembly protein PilY1
MKSVYGKYSLTALIAAAVLFPGIQVQAGNDWLTANGIRTDNVKLNNVLVDNNTYKADPPFVTTNVPPNVLIVLDNSGSMNDWAYAASYDSSRYDPSEEGKLGYYGYFDPSKTYVYTGKWEATTATTGTIANPVASGDFLNWATMRRIDVARKLLIGGKATPRSPNPGATVALYGETSPSPGWDFSKSDSGGRLSPFPAASYSYIMKGDMLYVRANYTVSDPSPRMPKSNANATWLPYPSTTALYRSVDDKTVNDSSDYIYLTSGTAQQLFGYTALTAGELTGTIQSVVVRMRATKTANQTMRVKGAIRIGTSPTQTIYEHSNYSNLSTSWNNYQFAWTVNPKRYDVCVAALDPDPTACAAWKVEDLTVSTSAYYLDAFGVSNITNASSSLSPRITWVELTVSLTAPEGGPYTIKVDWKGEDWAYAQGIIPNLGNEARFGLAMYNQGRNTDNEGGSVKDYDGGFVANNIGFNVPVNMVTSIHNMTPNTYTPLAETFFEMVRYFRQDPPHFANSPADFSVGQNYDPYYYQYTTVTGSSLPDQYVPCAKSFILMITDGEPTMDKMIPATATGVPVAKDLRDYDGDGKDPGSYSTYGSDYLDDVALWARTVDARPALDGDQNIMLYSVFAFGKNSQLLKDAAVNGGFDDVNGDLKPSCKSPAVAGNPTQQELAECYRDIDGNGILDPAVDMPLTYFEGDDGYELEASIIEAITAILKRASSGTSVSVLGSSWKGQGALYQAYFYPEKSESLRRIKWTGYFRSLFVDMMGLIHEDTDGDMKLIPDKDRVVNIVSTGSSADTMIEYYWDKNADGVFDTTLPIEVLAMDTLKPIWDAGKMLAVRDPADRLIYTSVDNANLISFDSTQAATLRPYVRGATTADADTVIRFTRGEQITNWRDRQLTVDGTLRTWKLADIVFSDPFVVQAPSEYFDGIYGSTDYYEFYKRWKSRRAVVYVGTNDGMLRAFNGGFSNLVSTEETIPPTEPQVVLSTGPNNTSDATRPLGKELWAFIPPDLLPHLAWHADPDYQHVFYVDLAPRVTDVRIFCGDPYSPSVCVDGQTSVDHPYGWGTIMLLGLRLGGGEIDVTDDFGSGTETRAFRSAYYALDITDPDSPPKLLWRFSDPDLGFTTVLPTFMREDTDSTRHNANEKWYVIFGSGPSTYLGNRALATNATDTKFTKNGVVAGLAGMTTDQAQVYVLDLKTGQASTTWSVHSTSGMRGIIRFPDVAAFNSGVTSMDFLNSDFNTDTAYIGTTFCTSSCSTLSSAVWGGNMYRIATMNNIDPGAWTMSKVFTAGRPITAKPSLARDGLNNEWLYFGTGRFIHVDDRFNTASQTFYGFKDDCWSGSCSTEVSIANLANVTNTNVLTTGQLELPLTYDTQTFTDITTFENYMEKEGKGWYRNMTDTGERVFVNGLVIGKLVAFGSFIPTTDICNFSGQGQQYFPYYLSGLAYNKFGDSMLTYTTTLGNTAVNYRSSKTAGVPSPPAVHVSATGQVKLFIQNSTGAISTIAIDPPEAITGGTYTWIEKISDK